MTAVSSALLTALLLPLTGAAGPQSVPVNEVDPSISGVAVKGQTLAANPGSWAGSPPVTFSYQWRRCDASGAACSDVVGATGQTRALVSGDVGKRMRVLVTAVNADGTANELSGATATVTDGTPVSQSKPSVVGTPVEGQRLWATNGTWAGIQPMTFEYQWLRCGVDGGGSSGDSCVVVSGATKSAYTAAAADVGSRVRARVTAKNSAGSTAVASEATAVVNVARAPSNTRRPAIVGSSVEGVAATLDRGTWTGASSFTEQWLRCNSAGRDCVPIPGATAAQYRFAVDDVGHRIRANVTASNSRGTTTATSGASATVRASGPAGVVMLAGGERSIPATSVSPAHRLVVADVRFSPRPIRSRTAPITIRVRVQDTRGYVVRDALVFVRSTPLVTTGRSHARTALGGWATFTAHPRVNFPRLRRGHGVQFFVKAYRAGDPVLGGVAGYRLAQVRLAR